MNRNVALAQPILVEVADDGRLIRADARILRLHFLAGGQEGGVLAIPSLAALAAATQKLKMRLARAVKVADEDSDIQLWVETEVANDITRLKIIGWNAFDKSSLTPSRDAFLEHSDGDILLVFNQQLLLVSILGGGEIVDLNIGVSASAVFDSSSNGNDLLLDGFLNRRSIQVEGVKIGMTARSYSVTAESRYNQQQVFVGYVCRLRPENAAATKDISQIPNEKQQYGQQLSIALRQPLGRIIANAETIGSKLQGPIRDSYATYAKDIANAARYLVALVDDLGDLEVIERDGFTTAEDHIELGDIARRVAGLLALKAADHNIVIETPDENIVVGATAEFRRVLQIAINLVTNAIRYSPDGTRISIQVSGDDQKAQMTVLDEGKGIPEEDRDKVFDKFERLGRSGDGGSGLGLYISRRLARSMGGELSVVSTDAGGAKFVLTLPA
jgi:signal transduction histidine kinase